MMIKPNRHYNCRLVTQPWCRAPSGANDHILVFDRTCETIVWGLGPPQMSQSINIYKITYAVYMYFIRGTSLSNTSIFQHFVAVIN